MGRFASDNGSGSFTPAPVGTHIARCYRIIDIGTQSGEWQGKPTRRNQIIVGWELSEEMMDTEDGPKPITVTRFYTNSLGDRANLRHDLEAWRGRAFTQDELNRFDLESILGKPCMLTIVGGENDKTKVSTVSGVPKGFQAPPQVNESFTFWLDDFDQEKFESLSDGFQSLVKKSEEYPQVSRNGRMMPNDVGDDSDIPF